jgi:hypothetical protein
MEEDIKDLWAVLLFQIGYWNKDRFIDYHLNK